MFRNTLIGSFLMLCLVGILAAQVPAPTDLTATLSSGVHKLSVTLEWQYGTTTSPVRFVVYRKNGGLADSGKFVKYYTTTAKKYIDNYVVANKTYSYYVVATQGTSVSDPSNKVEILITPPVITYGNVYGTLTEDGGTVAIKKATVEFIPGNSTGKKVVVYTDTLGLFKAKLLTGNYYMHFSARNYISEYYDNVPTLQQATLITVAPNDSLVYAIGLAKVVPPVYYTVTGNVSDAGGNPLKAEVQGFIVNKRPGVPGVNNSMVVRTDSLGNFKLKTLENDTLVVFVNPFNKTFKPEYWNNKETFATADRIPVTGNITGINVVLDPKPVYANGISGSVKDSAGTLGLKGVVYAYKKATTGTHPKRYAVKTDSLTGAYSFVNMEPGQYILLAHARGYKSTYFKYDGSHTNDWRQADSVVVTENGVVPNINFNLWAFVHPAGGNNRSLVFGNISAQAEGNVLEYALANIVDVNGEIVGSAVSDLDGYYMIDQLENGYYSIVTNAPNYQDASVKNFFIDGENSGTNLDIVITPEQVTSVSGESNTISNYVLNQNYPNPFNPSTLISFSIPEAGQVRLSVYNLIGQKVAELINSNLKAGNHQINFNANNLSSGIYYYRLEAGNFTDTKKMILIK